MRVKKGQVIWYENYYKHKGCGQVLWVKGNGDFAVSSNPGCRMSQYDDSFRSMNIEDEGKLFWLEPTPENPIPIKAQQAMSHGDLRYWLYINFNPEEKQNATK